MFLLAIAFHFSSSIRHPRFGIVAYRRMNRFLQYLLEIKGWLTLATESEAESESEAQGALRSSVNQKTESEAESEARRNRSQKDQKSLGWFTLATEATEAES